MVSMIFVRVCSVDLRAPPLAVGHAADGAGVLHERADALEEGSRRMVVPGIAVERLAEERDAAIASEKRSVHDLFQVHIILHN